MRIEDYKLIDKDFVIGFRTQEEWSWLIATAFFLGEIGAGLFFISFFLNYKLGALIGLLIVALGKNTAHLLYLGHPLRAWRAVLKPQTSWISRGLISVVVFMIFGFLYIAPSFNIIPINDNSVVYDVIKFIALISAFIVIIYDGFVMAYSPSIPLWNTALLPMLCLTYSLLGGTTLSILLIKLGYGSELSLGMKTIELVELLFIITNLIMLLIYVMTMYYATTAAKFSVMLLIKEKYSVPFLGGVIFVGLILTLLLLIIYTSMPIVYLLVVAALTELIGDFLIRFLLLKAGTYSPVVAY
jgi:formate-dependent nitrite reductase membrane component NrfD